MDSTVFALSDSTIQQFNDSTVLAKLAEYEQLRREIEGLRQDVAQVAVQGKRASEEQSLSTSKICPRYC